MEPIAIVGIDCRFPGAPDTGAYWDLLMRGADGVGEIPRQRWDAKEFYAQAGDAGHANTTEGGFIADPDAFDHEFFTVSPREAAAMDPQQRLLLQSAWRAVEDAGIAPRTLAATPTGVFVGIMGNEWAHLHLTDYGNVTPQTGSGNGYCMTANRISYHLDLKGPSLAVDTACSSSLVATHLAVNALLSEECDHALVGGVNVALTPALSIFYTQAGLSAPDGRCKPFSSEANGIGRGEGVGVVVLRRLRDALADGQRVYAVIRGTAVNQDGRSNGLTAPNRWAQQDVLAAAYRRARVEPADVVFTEAHGTGTGLGDMMEVKALGHHHAGRADTPMALGSVKGNIGHTEGAAGIAGLIKVALSLHHRVVPTSRFAAKENRQLALRDHGLRLLKAPLRLPPGPTVAGLSSFGMGGTNAHAVLESAPAARPRPAHRATPSGIGAAVFTLTAPNADALRRNLLTQADAAAARRVPLGPLARSANRVKAGHRHRFATTATDTGELVAALRESAADPALLARLTGSPTARPRVAFLFSGQGSQYPRMTAALYEQSPLYRHFLDEADAALLPYTGRSVRDLLRTGDEAVHRTRWTQPALFAVGYALGRTLTELGAHPAMLLGHSVGEFAAAVLARALPLDGAARLVAARGALMEELPAGGGMLAVRVAQEDLAARIEREPLIGLAAVNGPTSTVLSGDLDALERIGAEIAAEGVTTRRLQVSHAFHSPLMRPVLARFAAIATEVGGGVPEIPVYSTVRGRVLDGEAMGAAYWVEHIGATVQFGDAAAALLADDPTHLVEIGARPVLCGMVRRLDGHAPGTGPAHVLPVRGPESGGRELADALAELYRGGVEPDWDAAYAPEERVPHPLPPYTFSTEHRFWARNPVRAPGTVAVPADEPVAPAFVPRQQPRTSLALDLPGRAADPVAEAVLDAVRLVGGYTDAEVGPHDRLYEDLGFDSVMVMELKNRLEDRLTGIGTLTVQDLLPRLSSVGDLITFLRELGAMAPDFESLGDMAENRALRQEERTA
ncbi:beta-ketoacyl synthase N-terminal-like domain-containing protein [Streptomyces sp. NPDC052051]|uniref:type I polyketide synthase n=1 Tax=Streptomyces sp. NPDC052051 TaxID=3154649 RepID=UPI003439C684